MENEETVQLSKSHTCEICNQTFNRKSHLDRHARVHQEIVTNVVCTECSKTFANLANLKTHFIDTHIGKTMASPKLLLVTKKGNDLIELL